MVTRTPIIGTFDTALTDANSVITGTHGHDQMAGYGGSDLLRGGSGNDTIVGGKGGDVMVGGMGNDAFIFARGDSGTGASRDTITDFDRYGDDVLIFQGISKREVTLNEVHAADGALLGVRIEYEGLGPTLGANGGAILFLQGTSLSEIDYTDLVFR